MQNQPLWMAIGFCFSFGISAWANVPPSKFSASNAQFSSAQKLIRVRLSDLGSVISIKSAGMQLALAQNPVIGQIQNDEWVIDCKRNQIVDPKTGRARLIPRGGLLFQSESKMISLNGRRFRDRLIIYPDSAKPCWVINVLPIETYLESVVNAEFNSQWAESAVEAQVIAARTYAWYQIQSAKADSTKRYDVESTQKDQVYLGMDRVDDKAREIVLRTRGLILTEKKSAPIKAFYHAACGGETVLPQQVWNTKVVGFKRPVKCRFCQGSPSYQWQHQMSFYEIQRRLDRAYDSDSNIRQSFPLAYRAQRNAWILMGLQIPRPSSIADALIPAADAAENLDRVKDLTFLFSNPSEPSKKIKVRLDAYQFRNWLGPSQVKSTAFEVKQKGRSIEWTGRGSGHGVGLCQWGAKRMGELGYSAQKILNHYYPGVKLLRFW